METQPFDSRFRRAVEESDTYYDEQAENAKARIWQRVRDEKKKTGFPVPVRWLSAACIVLLLGTTLLLVLLSREHRQVRMLTEQIGSLRKVSGPQIHEIRKETAAVTISEEPVHDTLFLEKKVLVYQPVTLTEKVKDTVYISKITYVEKECPEQLALRQEASGTLLLPMPPQPEKEILISNKDTRKAEKRRKFILWPGGNGNRAGDESGAITLNF